jgi:hypothetical protein
MYKAHGSLLFNELSFYRIMTVMQIEIQNTVDDETAAAIVAAVAMVLSTPHSIPSAITPPRSAWALAGIRENHSGSDGAMEPGTLWV